jgi:hypothetical protein
VSEYQYYEFQAIDRALTDAEQKRLRESSTRAEITSTSFVNEYHWGDFRGNVVEWMKRYFDAFIYVTNWGTHQLMLRVPRRLIDLKAAQAYAAESCMEIVTTAEHVVFNFLGNTEEPEGWEEGEGRLAGLMPVRNELLAGDLRALYLGWLAGVAEGHVEDDAVEPPVPPGLSHLSASLAALADFLWVDDELVEAAAAGSCGDAPAGPTPEELAEWVRTLPEADKDAALVRVLRGEGVYLGSELLHRYRAEQLKKDHHSKPAQEARRRTAGELRDEWEKCIERDRRRAAEEKATEEARQAKKRAAQRKKHLDGLEGREESLWKQAEALIAAKLPKKYDEAVTLLADLRDLAKRSGREDSFVDRMRRLSERHASKRTFMDRLRKAGL